MRGARRSDGMIRLGGAPADKCEQAVPATAMTEAYSISCARHAQSRWNSNPTAPLCRPASVRPQLQRCLRDVHAVASQTIRLGAIAGPAGATEV